MVGQRGRAGWFAGVALLAVDSVRLEGELRRIRPSPVLLALCGLPAAPTRNSAQGDETTPLELRVAQAICDSQVVVPGELAGHGEGKALSGLYSPRDYRLFPPTPGAAVICFIHAAT